MVKLIGDIGSCHMGKMGYAKETIGIGVESGLDAVKFQLFTNKPPNIELPYSWMPELIQYGKDLGIEVFASVWDLAGIQTAHKAGCKSIKFAYSMRATTTPQGTENALLHTEAARLPFENTYISGDLKTVFPFWATKLFCIPEYPVTYIIDFEGLFPRFDGFSDHTLGWQQTLQAVKAGAMIIEKHFTLDHADINCPDNNFALKPNSLRQMVQAIRRVEQ